MRAGSVEGGCYKRKFQMRNPAGVSQGFPSVTGFSAVPLPRSQSARICSPIRRVFASTVMGSAKVKMKKNKKDDQNNQRCICLHAFSDLSQVSPVMFVYLLKECYLYGTLKATLKFRVLQQQVLKSLRNSPRPGPAIFILQCLYIVPFLGPLYTEGFSHLLISPLQRLQYLEKTSPITPDSKRFAAKLFLDILSGLIPHEERILLKILEAFDIELQDISEAICESRVHENCLETAKLEIAKHISKFLESKSYTTAVCLLGRFQVHQYCLPSESLLDQCFEENMFSAAEKLATSIGGSMIHVLVKKYVDLNMMKQAYLVVKNNDLAQEFPDVYYLYKKSSMKKLAKKGLWDIAEIKANNETLLVEYLVQLAAEVGYMEKVDELCERHSFNDFDQERVSTSYPPKPRYLDVKEFVLDGITWVDDIQGLHLATSHIKDIRVLGIDCEWKPNYEKGMKPNKVSIMQIASEKRVFIFDLIKLYEEERRDLDECLKSVFHSSKILKLGYNFQCDLRQLGDSYGDLDCFRSYEMLLDIQRLFQEDSGGLSGVSEKIFGFALDKTRRNSDWEQRPLTQNQVEYAALDAAVLVHIFYHIRSRPHPLDDKPKTENHDWRSHIVSIHPLGFARSGY